MEQIFYKPDTFLPPDQQQQNIKGIVTNSTSSLHNKEAHNVPTMSINMVIRQHIL